MYDSELQFVLDQITKANYLEDIFGCEVSKSSIKKNFRQLAKYLHPDVHVGTSTNQIKIVEEGFKKLNEYYEKSLDYLSKGEYGLKKPLSQMDNSSTSKPNSIIITINEVEYHLLQLLIEADVSKVYSGKAVYQDRSEQNIIIKVSYGETADDIRGNNQLLKNEATTVQALWKDSDNPNLRHLPRFLACFQIEGGGVQKISNTANVLTYSDGYDFYTIRDHRLYERGVGPRHLVWILSRILTTLGYVHSKGIVHGNINPEHLIVNPPDHNVCLIDWCYSIKELQQFRALNQEYSAPEVVEKKNPTPSADIYSLGKSMIFLAGGNLTDNYLPNTIPKDFKKLIQWMVLESPMQRPRDAYDLYEYLEELRNKIYGNSRFEIFEW